ncbi:SDR family NAD(P)-dependent oxidoreductase [Nocardioides nitrophenolicus]|uniref:SDR family NAD(P)-dependent oxidoreductase n=1 Tax=Nocardioides nitrophenolicus TaxID=60489 RepID=UPI00195C547A|nr:SDR family NAD(P)-dependent oxidoreductase [Nocardioides nitrophenolicus]MBM7516653.1 NAD(P)-dependent dehydrogenase (short-subunit alcohol dehydrogenase family) [Nocardioides nitrophenolicus]
MNQNSTRYDGRRVLITGGARGLGAAIAASFVAAGARVAVWDAPGGMQLGYPLSGAAELDAARELVGPEGHVAAVDVRDVAQVRAALPAAVEALGGLDVVICAAGVRTAATAATMSDADWDAVVDTNLHGTYHVLRESLAHLEASGRGRIVVVAAEEGRRGAFGLSHYAAAAWGQIGLAKSLAHEVADQGISLGVVCPGVMETAMTDDPAFWAVLQAGRDGSLATTGPDRGAAEHALRVRHPSSTTYVDLDAVVRAVDQLVSEPGLDRTGAVIDVSAGLAATNTA